MTPPTGHSTGIPGAGTAARGGFTLVEIVVVTSIVIALAAVTVPLVYLVQRDEYTAELVTLINTCRSACLKFHDDTERIPRESSQGSATARQLSLAQPFSGWKGPYLDHPLTAADNPFGGAVDVFDTMTPAGNFDLLGGGAPTSSGIGNCLQIQLVPEDIARLVDENIDGGVAGAWDVTGRVKWVDTNGLLQVHLADHDGI